MFKYTKNITMTSSKIQHPYVCTFCFKLPLSLLSDSSTLVKYGNFLYFDTMHQLWILLDKTSLHTHIKRTKTGSLKNNNNNNQFICERKIFDWVSSPDKCNFLAVFSFLSFVEFVFFLFSWMVKKQKRENAKQFFSLNALEYLYIIFHKILFFFPFAQLFLISIRFTIY